MNDEVIPMGYKINTHLGLVALPSEILTVAISGDCLQIHCIDGTYKVTKYYEPNEYLKIQKVFCP